MKNNILIAIGAAGFLSLSHADDDISLNQITEQPQISNSKEEASQERKEKAYAALKSFGIGAGSFLSFAVIFGNLGMIVNGFGKWMDFYRWKRFVDPREVVCQTALATGIIRSLFSAFVPKNKRSEHPYLASYGSTFLSAGLGLVIGDKFSWYDWHKNGQQWNPDLKYEDLDLEESLVLSLAVTGVHMFGDVALYFYNKYLAKKDSQEDEKSQEASDLVKA